MKRPNRRPVLILGASAAAFALSGCVEEKDIMAHSYDSLESCIADIAPNAPGAASCEASWLAAEAVHAETAPRYESMELCQEQHGPEACMQEAGAGNTGGSSFMPFLAGYMLAQAMSPNARSTQLSGKPLYATSAGGVATADNSWRSNFVGAKQQVTPAAFSKPAITKGLAPMTKATVSSRGGFGGGRSSSFGG